MGVCSERFRGWYEGVFVFGMTVVPTLPFSQIGPDLKKKYKIICRYNTLPISVNHEVVFHWNYIKNFKLESIVIIIKMTCHDT